MTKRSDKPERARLRRIWTHILKEHPLRLLSVITTVLAGTLLNLTNPLLMRIALDVAIPNRNVPLLGWLFAAMLLVSFLCALASSVQTMEMSNVGIDISDHFRKALYSRFIKQDLSWLGKYKPGQVSHIITRQCGQVGQVYVAQTLLPSVVSIVSALGTFSVMVTMDWRLTLVGLGAYPVHLLMTRALGGRLKVMETEYGRLLGEGEAFLHETLPGVKTIQILGGEDREISRWQRWLNAHAKLYRNQMVVRDLVRVVLNRVVTSIAVVLAFGFGTQLLLTGEISTGTIVAFLSYIPVLYGSFQGIQTGLIGNMWVQPALEQVYREVDYSPLVIEGQTSLHAQNTPVVTMDNVTFHYPDGRGGVRGVSLSIYPGELLAIVGPTGSGKSTLVDLLLRFYDPDEGTVALNGIDVRNYALRDVRKAFGVVAQEVILWNDSLRENIAYALSGVTDEQIETVCLQVSLADFVKTLQSGLDTHVGERGTSLSGGERQRVAIARALLRKAPILILDEATSALDPLTEQSIIKEMHNRVRRGQTVIYITHRVRLALEADRVIVMNAGEVVEDGAPEKLLANQGVFHRLCDADQGGAVE